MKNISLSEDVVPVGRFKAEMAAWLKRVSREHRHTVITQNGVPAAVLISPAEYDNMSRKNRQSDSVAYTNRAQPPSLYQRVRQALDDLYGKRFRGLLLYGSEARGEAQPDSDIDFLVLLEGPIRQGRERRKIIRTLYDIQLDYPLRHISYMPVDVKKYKAAEHAIYRNIQKEGVVI